MNITANVKIFGRQMRRAAAALRELQLDSIALFEEQPEGPMRQYLTLRARNYANRIVDIRRRLREHEEADA